MANTTDRSWDDGLRLLKRRNEDTEPVSEERLDAAQARLGVTLPESYRELMQQIGPLSWPLLVEGPEALVLLTEDKSRRPGDAPAWLLFFGSDGGELQFAFDTRRAFDSDELAVTSLDLEEGFVDEPAPSSAAGGLAGWLLEVMEESLAAERLWHLKDGLDRLEGLLREGSGHEGTHRPSERDVRAVEDAIGVELPDEYRAFTKAFGGTAWPLPVAAATSLTELKERVAGCPGDFVPVAREGERFFGFLSGEEAVFAWDGKGRPESTQRSFYEWLEERAKSARAAVAKEIADASEAAAEAARFPHLEEFPEHLPFRLRHVAGLVKDAGRLEAFEAGADRWGVKVKEGDGKRTAFFSASELGLLEELTGLSRLGGGH
jgi:hypothetical protein